MSSGRGIVTSLGAVTLALRAHHNDPNTEEEATDDERMSLTITAVESARRYTGSTDVAIRVRDKINRLSSKEWWDYQFLMHPSVQQFLHHRL
jgi:hypothetical protein